MIDYSVIARIAADIREYMGDDFDSDTFLDTLDGETNVLDLADWMLGKMMGDEALADAIGAQVAALTERHTRIAARANVMKSRLLTLLDVTGEKKIERPAATISRRIGSVSVRIVDEAAIPTQLCAVKTTSVPDKSAIKKQIDAGETVPGAELVRGPDGVTVRTK
jgi:Siphovirus Gp157